MALEYKKQAKDNNINNITFKHSDMFSKINNSKNIVKQLYTQNVFIKDYNDISQLGMFETSNESIKIVEWPELIKPKPNDRIDIFFKYSKLTNSRNVKITGFGKCKDYEFNEI